MRFRLFSALVLSTLVLGAQTQQDAEAFVKKAVLFAKANGRDAFLLEVNKVSGQFNFAVNKQLYISVYGLDGKVLAHGAKANHVGINQINAKDSNGKLYVKERLDLALAKGKGWLSYMEIDPATKKEQDKLSYIELHDGMVISCGIYKK